jgi:hypothetical protein
MHNFAKPVTPVRRIRAMRGHTQAQLIVASNGYAYVTKFINNPFGPRVLVAEWIAAQLMHAAGLPVPEAVLIGYTTACQDVPGGLHFGSRYPGHPESDAVFDFLPASLFNRVDNWQSLTVGIAAFDIWLANATARQAIFTRSGRSFQALFIDNTHLFGGPAWNLETNGFTGTLVPFTRSVLSPQADLLSWVKRIQRCTPAVNSIFDSIPTEWLPGADTAALQRILQELPYRASHLPDIVHGRSTNAGEKPRYAHAGEQLIISKQ